MELVRSRIGFAGLILGDFKTFSEFRVLEWDAYDVILGINWLRHYRGMWDLAGSRLRLENGSKRHCHLQMRPHRTLDPSSTLSEIGINAPSHNKAQRAIQDCPKSTKLYLLRDKERKQDHSDLPKIVDPRYEPVVMRYRGLFREGLLQKLAQARDITHANVYASLDPPIDHLVQQASF